jgi:hypothetical protein
VQTELLAFNNARPRDQTESGRRAEGFPDGGIIKHGQFLAVAAMKVNGGDFRFSIFDLRAPELPDKFVNRQS